MVMVMVMVFDGDIDGAKLIKSCLLIFTWKAGRGKLASFRRLYDVRIKIGNMSHQSGSSCCAYCAVPVYHTVLIHT